MSSTLGLARKAGLETKPAGICRCSCLLGVRRNSVLDPTSSIRKPMGQCPKESITVLSCCRQCEQLFKQHDDNLALSTFALEPVLSPLRSDSSVLTRHTHNPLCCAGWSARRANHKHLSGMLLPCPTCSASVGGHL